MQNATTIPAIAAINPEADVVNVFDGATATDTSSTYRCKQGPLIVRNWHGGTATVKIEVQFNGTWVGIKDMGDYEQYVLEYPVGDFRVRISAYTSGDVSTDIIFPGAQDSVVS